MHRTAWDYLASSWCWRILSRIPWRARRSNQPILKEINIFIGRTDTEAQAPILWSPDAKNWLIGKDLMLGKIEGRRRRGRQRMRWLNGITDSIAWVWVDSRSWWWWCTGRPGMLQFMGSQGVRHDWATELYWTELLSSVFHAFISFSTHWAPTEFAVEIHKWKTSSSGSEDSVFCVRMLDHAG